MPFFSEHFIMTDIMTFPVPTRFTILYCQAQSFSTILRNVLKEVLASTVYAASVAMANGWRGLWRDLYFTQHGVDFTRILTDVVG